jgi:hypothetical protein
VTGIATGDVTILAKNSGGSTSRLLHVLPSFAGTWQGNYAITGCQSLGGWTTIGFCNQFPSGTVLNLSLSINQTLDQVSGGSFSLGSNQGTLNSAAVANNGQLAITGLFSAVSSGVTTNINLGNARWDSLQAGTITGTFDQTWSQPNGLSGSAIYSCAIRLMTRTGGGPSSVTIFQRPEPSSASLDEIIRRLR